MLNVLIVREEHADIFKPTNTQLLHLNFFCIEGKDQVNIVKNRYTGHWGFFTKEKYSEIMSEIGKLYTKWRRSRHDI